MAPWRIIPFLAALILYSPTANSKDYLYTGEVYQPQTFKGDWIGYSLNNDSFQILHFSIGEAVDSVPLSIEDDTLKLNLNNSDFTLNWDGDKLYGLNDKGENWEFYQDNYKEPDSEPYYLDAFEERFGYLQFNESQTTPSLLFDGSQIIPFEMIHPKLGVSYDGHLLHFIRDSSSKLLQIQKDNRDQTSETFNLLPEYTVEEITTKSGDAQLYLLDEQIKNSVFIFHPSISTLPPDIRQLLQALPRYRLINAIWPDEHISDEEAWLRQVSEYYSETPWGEDQNQILIGVNLQLPEDLQKQFSGIADLGSAPDEVSPFPGISTLTVETGKRDELLIAPDWNRIIVGYPDLFFHEEDIPVGGSSTGIKTIDWTVFGGLYQWSRAADPKLEKNEDSEQTFPDKKSDDDSEGPGQQ